MAKHEISGVNTKEASSLQTPPLQPSFLNTHLLQSSALPILHRKKIPALLLVTGLSIFAAVFYAPHSRAEAAISANIRKTYDIPAGPLDEALNRFARQSGVYLSFAPSVAQGKRTNGLRGEYNVKEGFATLLAGSGLQALSDQQGAYYLAKLAPNIKKNKDAEFELKETVVKAKRFKDIGPLPGLNLTKEQIAGNIQSISAKEIKEAHALSLSDLLNSKLQSVNVNDYQGNPFQMDVTYRGFTASPQIGTPQGLSVFFDGVRVNEPFGDVVNWDMIPMNAISGLDVFPGSNPLFGLNTLGGSFVMKTKSGFTDEGVSAEILAGSYGRKQLQASGGWNNANKEKGSWDIGDYAAFGAVNLFLEDGWRDNSPSEVNQAYGKLEWQGERASLSFSGLGVINKLVGNGTVPQELYRQDASAVFTSPDETKNTLMQLKIAGAFDVTDHFNITGQVFNRNSKRNSTTGDIIDVDTFSPAGDYHHFATRLAGTGKSLQCGYADDNSDGVPNYYVINEADLILAINSYTSSRTFSPAVAQFNPDVPEEITDALKFLFTKKVYDPLVNNLYVDATDTMPEGMTTLGGFMDFGTLSIGVGFVDTDGSRKRIFAADPLNISTCKGFRDWNQGMLPSTPFIDRNGAGGYSETQASDGIVRAGTGTGFVEGTPTAIITNSDIRQNTTGAALQLNWNYDTHKFMIGASFDKSKASYIGKQRLGLIDDNRNVYSDASQLGEEYYAADHDLTINDFEGTSGTKSLYFSETWTPTQTLNFSLSGRYNATHIQNDLAPTKAERTLTGLRYLNRYLSGVICSGSDLSNCPYSLDKPILGTTYWNELVDPSARDLLGGNLGLLDKAATEKFSFYSFNPAIGGTWQAKPNLNLYANWNQGTRAPSVIELGCAYDPTPVGPNGTPRSLVEGRGCKLPSSLSGDPFLPQVKARTVEVGARGKFSDFLEWNVSAYRTNVIDDIYMTSLTSELSFFQSIGDTRRQGIEFGIAGEYGKSDFRINYSLTEATFQSYFKTASSNNSSRGLDLAQGNYNLIQVQPGNVMPGVPFNNLNFNWGYKFTPKFKANMSVVAHSRSFLRGNENNAHTPTQGRNVVSSNGGVGVITTADNNYSGTAPGYAVLNMNARYDLGKGWALSALVNNVLDKKYYTAGRLGVTPFAPSTFGAIGPGGFNYNSNEWIPTQFISAGAPRGMWLSVAYDFNASKKSDLPNSIAKTEPNLFDLEPPANAPTEEELMFAKQLAKVKALPILKGIKSAKQDILKNIESWRKALSANDSETFVSLYASSFSPAKQNRQDWVEQQKIRFSTEAASMAEVQDIVIAPQEKKMVAVFTHVIARGEKQEQVRKVLTYEQLEGEWKIVREHDLPIKNTLLKVNDASKVSQLETSLLKQRASKKTVNGTPGNELNSVSNVAQMETK